MAEEMNNGSLGAKATIESGSAVKGAKEYIDSISNMEKATLKLGSTVDDIEKQLRVLENQYQINKNALKQLNSTLVEGSANYAENSSNIEKLNAIQKQLATTINECRVKLDNLKDAHEGVREAQEEATDNIKEGTKELKKAREEADKSAQSFDLMKRALIAIGGVTALKAFGQQVLQVRGEFQQLEVAFKTMLGSEEEATALMQEIIHITAKTPQDLQSVADGAKQLLAYGVSASEVIDVLTRLGDIAAGLSIPLGDLVYLYGTTLTQGRLFTQDLRQFMGRGIPLAEELAKQFGVTKDKVGELVTAGKVGADEFKQAIFSMTNEGSKFSGLMEEQSKTITGQISNIGDAIDRMFNKIGNKSEGIINSGLAGVSYMVENWEDVGRVIGEVIAVYGTYKAAVMTVTAINALQASGLTALTLAEKAHYAAIILTEKAQALLNKTILANPYALIAASVAALVAVVYELNTQETDLEKAQSKLNDTVAEFEKQQSSEIHNIDILFSRLQLATEGTKEYEDAKQDILNQYGQYLNGLGEEIRTLQDVAGAYDAVKNSALEAAKARAMETATKTASDDLASTLGDIKVDLRKKIEKKYGDTKLEDGILASEYVYKTISNVVDTNRENGEAIKMIGIVGSIAKDAIAKATEAHNVYNTIVKDAKERFGINDSPNKLGEIIVTPNKKNKTTTTGDNITPKKDKKDNAAEEARRKAETEKQIAEELAAMRLQNQKAKDELAEESQQKRLKLAEDGYNEEIAAINKKHDEIVKKRGGNLTPEEEEVFTNARLNAKKKYEKQVENINKEEADKEKKHQEELLNSRLEYQKEYGSIEEQRGAINEQFQKMFDDAKGDIFKQATIKEQWDEALRKLNFDALKENLDWEEVFANLDVVSKAKLEKLKDQLQEYLKQGTLTPEQAKVIGDQLGKIDEEYAKRNPFSLFSASKDKRKKYSNDGTEKTLEKLTNAINDFLDTNLTKTLLTNISSLPGLMSQFGIGDTPSGQAIGNFANGVNSGMNALTDFASGNYIGALTNAFSALGNFGDIIGIGSGNEKEVAETTERLTKANEVLSDRISDLTEVMGNSAGARAIYASEKALEAQKEINKNAMDILKAQMSYNSSHHSNAYYADDATIRSYNRSAQEAFAAAGVDASTINGLSSIYNLTPEQLKAIRDFAPDLWKYLTEVGKYDKSEYWEKVVDLAGKTEEITEQINNNLTQTSFDSMRDSFLDALTDMDSTASDFSQKLEDMFFKATVNSMVLGDEFDNWLKDWQARWAEAEKNGNKAVLDDLRIEAENMRENLIEERDRLADDLGYDKNISVSASGKGYTTMSEDTGDALLGMNTAIHIAVEDGNVQREQLLGNSLLQTGYISEIRDIQLESVGLLNGIEKNTRNLIQMAADLAEVKPHLMRL